MLRVENRQFSGKMGKGASKAGIRPMTKVEWKGIGENKTPRCPGLADCKTPKALSGTRQKEQKRPKSVVTHARDGSCTINLLPFVNL